MLFIFVHLNSQRRTWIEIAHQYPNVEIWGVQMDTPYEVGAR